MDFVTQNWSLILVAVLSGGYLMAAAIRKSGRSDLTPAQVVQKINQEKAVVIDIRPAENFALGHISGSRNMTAEQIQAADFKGMPKNKTRPVVLISATSYIPNKVTAALKEAGYEDVHMLGGGIGAWIKEELPLHAIESGDKKE